MRDVVVGILCCVVVLGAGVAKAQSIAFTLDGKPVSSVPVDRLGDVVATASAGGAFKATFGGQWQGIDQSLALASRHYKKGGAAPDIQKSGDWARFSLARTGDDKSWGTKTSLSTTLAKAGKADGLQLFQATTGDEVLFTLRFRRHVYTGKLIWEGGKQVKETTWESAGPAVGQAVLKLAPPTFAASLKSTLGKVTESTVTAMNVAPKNEFKLNPAMTASRFLLYPTSFGGREVKFTGSKMLKMTGGDLSTIVYNWNYDGDDQLVYAGLPVSYRIHAAMQTEFDGIDELTKTEADFGCEGRIETKRTIKGGDWSAAELGYDAIATQCKTDDGKTPESIAKSVRHPGDVMTEELQKELADPAKREELLKKAKQEQDEDAAERRRKAMEE